MEYFWTNTVWYLLLGLFTVIQLVLSIIKATRRKFTFAYYITLVGLVLIFETLILIGFKSYYYYPKIILSSSFDDALTGNLFSQFSVASTALMFAVFNLKNYWIFVLAGIYALVETIFLMLGIYQQYWYRTWMTFVLLTVFFWWAKRNYLRSPKVIKPSVYYFYVFTGLFTLNVVTILWGFILSGYQNYTQNLFSDPIRGPYLVAALYFLVLSSSIMLIYYLKLRWAWKIIVFLMLYGLDYMAYKLHIFYIKEGWFLIFSTVTIFWTYFSVILLDRLYKSEGNPIHS